MHGIKKNEGGRYMYYLACCDSEGKCIGFLRNDRTMSEDPDNETDKLMAFKKKGDANETILQINMSRLLPYGYPFRVTLVKG